MIDAILEPVLLICIIFLMLTNLLLILEIRSGRKK